MAGVTRAIRKALGAISQKKGTSLHMDGAKTSSGIERGSCTETYGSTSTERYLTATISTTLTETGAITNCRTWSAYPQKSIGSITAMICRLKLLSQIRSIEKSHLKLFLKEQPSRKNMLVRIALPFFSLRALRRNIARVAAVAEQERGISSEALLGVPVYDLSVEGHHEFFANGVLVHNCTPDGGAYTAGVKMAKTEDGFIVLDVVRGQWSAHEREKRIRQTAEMDGVGCHVWVEQEPGSGGKESAENTIRNLAGFVIKSERATGEKSVRAQPYAAQVQGGNVKIVKADWNKDFLNEHETFPNGKYKDQVDAAAGAFNKLVSGHERKKGYGLTMPKVMG